MYPSIRVRTAPPVSVRVSVSFTVLCLQRWRLIFLMCPYNYNFNLIAKISAICYYLGPSCCSVAVAERMLIGLR